MKPKTTALSTTRQRPIKRSIKTIHQNDPSKRSIKTIHKNAPSKTLHQKRSIKTLHQNAPSKRSIIKRQRDGNDMCLFNSAVFM